jgi:hypothetical protein
MMDVRVHLDHPEMAKLQPGAKPQEIIATGNKGLKARSKISFETVSPALPASEAWIRMLGCPGRISSLR